MDQKKYESISALLDGEANELEVQRLLSDFDDESFELVKRQMAIRSVLRSPDEIAFANLDISAAVSAEINEESGIEKTASIHAISIDEHEEKTAKPVAAGYWQKGFGIAACAVLSVFAVLRFDPSNNPGAVDPVNATIASSNAAPLVEQRQPVVVEQMTPADVKRFNEYLLRHAEYASYGSGQGLMPLARVASVSSVGI